MITSIYLGAFGPKELLLIAGAALLLFGGKKLPGLFKGLGTGLREFKEAREGNIAPDSAPEKAVEEKSVKL